MAGVHSLNYCTAGLSVFNCIILYNFQSGFWQSPVVRPDVCSVYIWSWSPIQLGPPHYSSTPNPFFLHKHVVSCYYSKLYSVIIQSVECSQSLSNTNHLDKRDVLTKPSIPGTLSNKSVEQVAWEARSLIINGSARVIMCVNRLSGVFEPSHWCE